MPEFIWGDFGREIAFTENTFFLKINILDIVQIWKVLKVGIYKKPIGLVGYIYSLFNFFFKHTYVVSVKLTGR